MVNCVQSALGLSSLDYLFKQQSVVHVCVLSALVDQKHSSCAQAWQADVAMAQLLPKVAQWAKLSQLSLSSPVWLSCSWCYLLHVVGPWHYSAVRYLAEGAAA